ncbi:hypothetical protein PFICI_12681 [Pestalotiopsis fici W106-1]|uniref:Uncharacterized protein n=1 Tax=Pestalotiopsis fici (strain W106-1 / CGMCC3.15140) TaxID=1229662 RepID=W3WRI8_PESFW|nr:uncharacterized protein PFICI_12681 [Pestalotiopsis fici W106-1]ETS75737.1 hypothetical protein PFICI_12681 [Pestalotiopsis fici W106-1]
MSVKPEHDQASAWNDAYMREISARRKQEADQLNRSFEAKYEHIRGPLVRLYDRRAELHKDLQNLVASIKSYEAEQEHLGLDWDAAHAALNARFEEEDRMLAARERERVEANGHGRPSPSHGTSAQQSGGWTSINGSQGRKDITRDGEEISGGNYRHAEDGTNGKTLPYRVNGNGFEMDESDPSLAGRRPLKPKQLQQQPPQRHSLPGFHSEISRGMSRLKPDFGSCLVFSHIQDSPVDAKGRSPSGRRSLPGVRAHSQAPEPANPADLREINRETLELKNDGTVYTEPPMYAGVPLQRITPEHEYWDPDWLPLEDHIQPQLDAWQQKLDKLRQDKLAVRHTVFLANRQVNRGQAIIDFLRGPNPEFHPYQYVGKEMMAKFYKTFINYDTMFRLINVHEELKKFDLDITPLEWLRQRMYEVATAQGDKFNLSKYTHDLYHDIKLKVLREKHGFGNIGRPSGYKVGEKNPEKGKAKLKREQMGMGGRRKGRRSIGQVDMDDTQSLDGYPQQPQQEFLDPLTPRLQKRPRIEDLPPMLPHPPPMPSQQMVAPLMPPSAPGPVVDDLEHDGWSSTDSFSAGTISHLDWRIHQIKTPQHLTNPEVTQYWTFKKDSRIFEHQILHDISSGVVWGKYDERVNFDLKLDDIVEIQYASDSPRIAVLLRGPERSHVLAQFKRERTKRRFLAFSRKQGVSLAKTTATHLDDTWASMKSEEFVADK